MNLDVQENLNGEINLIGLTKAKISNICEGVRMIKFFLIFFIKKKNKIIII